MTATDLNVWQQLHLNRRKALSVGGMGLLGLTAPKLLQAAETGDAAPAARAKSVVFLYQFLSLIHI